MTPPINQPVVVNLPQEWIETCGVLRSHVPYCTEALGVLPMLAIAKEHSPAPAFTDGKSITICPEMWDELMENTKQRGLPIFPTPACGRAVLVLHELLHIVNRHKEREGHRDHKLWIQACDYVVNEMVVDFLRMPPFNYRGDKLKQLEGALSATGLLDPKYYGKTAEEVYAALEEQQEQQDKNGKPKAGGQPGQGAPDPNGQPSDEDGEGDGDGEGGDISDMFGDDFGNDVPDSGIPKDLGELVQNALKDYSDRNSKKMHSPNGQGSRDCAEAAKKPPVRLEDVLRKLCDTSSEVQYAYTRPGKNDAWLLRTHGNVRMPSPRPAAATKLKTLCLCVDSSGSMSNAELAIANRLLLEAFKHVKGREVRRIIFTTKVVENEVVRPDMIPPIKHSGGTRISSIIDEILEKKINPSAIILLTDAESSEEDIKRFETFKFLNKMRTVIIRNPGAKFPGVCYHCDTIE